MTEIPEVQRVPESGGRSVFRASGWLSLLLIFVGLALVYLANGQEIGTYDTIGTALLPLTILRGDGVYLDRFRPILREGDGRLPAYLGRFGPLSCRVIRSVRPCWRYP
jgi:hypothetical protein